MSSRLVHRALVAPLLAAMLAFTVVAVAAPAHAYRPAPGVQVPDQCRNVRGYQGLDDILMGRYRVLSFHRWLHPRNICVPGPRHHAPTR